MSSNVLPDDPPLNFLNLRTGIRAMWERTKDAYAALTGGVDLLKTEEHLSI